MVDDFECGPTTCKVGCGCGIFLVTLILVLTSLSQVQFNEYAFSKAWGQPIDQTVVYEQGVHFLGFWNSLVVFPADVVDLQLRDLSVFSLALGEDAGTTLTIDVGIQYKLDPDFLSDLFDIGGETGYIKQIEAVAVEEIKNNATGFNADSYLSNRRAIETSFRNVLIDVIQDSFANTEVINVELLKVVFPDSFYQRKLAVGLQEIDNDIQAFKRTATRVRDQTARKVLEITNRAKKIVDVAKAEALLITTKANNEFDRIVGQAKEEGMRLLASELGIEDEQQFLSMNYLVQILNNEGKQKKFVNFGQTPPARSLIGN